MIFNVAAGLLIPPLSGISWHCLYKLVRVRASVIAGWMWSAVMGTIASVIEGPAAFAVGAGASFLIALAIWWWRRKDRKRAARELGYKARARLAAVVRRAREAAQPRPVLQPQRQGAS